MNVISYCIFGDLYWESVPAVVRAHHNLFPGWEMWVHHDNTIDRKGYLLNQYAAHGLLKLIPCGESKQIGVSALWRFKPLWEPGVEYMLSRDIDSLPLPKERRMVDVFVNSGKVAHCITDHPEHRVVADGGFMAGMCGFHAPRTRQLTGIKSWAEFVAPCQNMDVWSGGPDQQHLYWTFWNVLLPYLCQHRLGTNMTGPWLFNHVEPVPLPDVPQRVQDEGDSLMPFMGCPGFDIPKAIAFYHEHGDPVIKTRLKAAEAYPFK